MIYFRDDDDDNDDDDCIRLKPKETLYDVISKDVTTSVLRRWQRLGLQENSVGMAETGS